MLFRLGVLWVIFGVIIWINGDPALYEHVVLLNFVPHEIRACMWILTGMIAIFYSVRPRTITQDGIGFLALYLMPVYRAVAFAVACVDSLIPFATPGYRSAWSGAFVYAAVCMIIYEVARWDEPNLIIRGGGGDPVE